MDPVNTTSIIGLLVVNATQYVTGSLSMTYFLITLILVIMALAFSIPYEFALILTVPLNLYLMFLDASFLPIGGTVLLVLALSLAWRVFSN